MKKKLLRVLILIFSTVVLFTIFALSADIPRMTKEEVKAMLGNPNLVILDVRFGSDYFASDFKIKGAERPYYGCGYIETYQNPNKTFVIYCSLPNEGTSAAVAQCMKEKGFTKVYVLKGGWEEWLKANYPIEKK